MTKLKTLKDIEGIYEHTQEVIKEEAIKWVKVQRGYHNKFRDARADIMMEFHNITEDDLK